MCECYFMVGNTVHIQPENKQEISLKKDIPLHFSCGILGLYVLLFVTQGHPTWDSIINTVTMKTLLPIQGTIDLIQNHCLIPLRTAT